MTYKVPCQRISRSSAQVKSLKCPGHATAVLEPIVPEESVDVIVFSVSDGDMVCVERDSDIPSVGVGGGVARQGAQ